jgi:hypothetical protein
MFGIHSFSMILIWKDEPGGKVTGCGMDGHGSIPGRVREFFLYCHVQTNSCAHPSPLSSVCFLSSYYLQQV